ncbi:MAG: aminotransferase class IV [Nitrospirota bacterium]
MNHLHYFNSRWVPESELLISARDLSVARGFGIFDFLRTYQKKPFRLKEHIDRFYRSADYLELQIPVSKTELFSIVEKGLSINDLSDAAIRMTLTGGVSPDFMTPANSSLIVGFYPCVNPDPKLYEQGAHIITTPTMRHLPRAKSLSYLTAVLAQRAAKRVGAIEALYVDTLSGNVFEGTTTNIFCVKDGGIITPGKDILLGITRGVVFELCESLQIVLREQGLRLRIFLPATRLFLRVQARRSCRS